MKKLEEIVKEQEMFTMKEKILIGIGLVFTGLFAGGITIWVTNSLQNLTYSGLGYSLERFLRSLL